MVQVFSLRSLALIVNNMSNMSKADLTQRRALPEHKQRRQRDGGSCATKAEYDAATCEESRAPASNLISLSCANMHTFWLSNHITIAGAAAFAVAAGDEVDCLLLQRCAAH
jgi:hypothetical protein